jgi:hypothetical protein
MTRESLKKKVRHELIGYAINVVYLALVFGAFTVYRRLLLAAHDIAYTQYGIAVIEALILGKVIMIGDFLRLGRGLESKPLIYPTLYKTVVFCAFVAFFKVIENGVRGLLKGEGFGKGAAEIWQQGLPELLANTLVVFVALLPFFAVKELGRVLGQVLGRETLGDLFFRRRDNAWGPKAEVGSAKSEASQG